MAASHHWGQNLIAAGVLTAEQNREIAESFPAPSCPLDYPTPQRLPIADSPAPDMETLRQKAAAEIAAWEAENGPLPEMELNALPPVFGLEGYGPADEG